MPAGFGSRTGHTGMHYIRERVKAGKTELKYEALPGCLLGVIREGSYLALMFNWQLMVMLRDLSTLLSPVPSLL